MMAENSGGGKFRPKSLPKGLSKVLKEAVVTDSQAVGAAKAGDKA